MNQIVAMEAVLSVTPTRAISMHSEVSYAREIALDVDNQALEPATRRSEAARANAPGGRRTVR